MSYLILPNETTLEHVTNFIETASLTELAEIVDTIRRKRDLPLFLNWEDFTKFLKNQDMVEIENLHLTKKIINDFGTPNTPKRVFKGTDRNDFYIVLDEDTCFSLVEGRIFGFDYWNLKDQEWSETPTDYIIIYDTKSDTPEGGKTSPYPDLSWDQGEFHCELNF